MSEETTQVKISMPLIDDIELQRIDTFYNDIVSEYTKAFVKEKEQVIIQRLMMNLQQENQQLKERNENQFNDLMKRIHSNNDKYLEESNKLIKENFQLKEVIEEVRKSIKDFQEYIDEAKEFYSDLEDDDVVKVSNLQLLNNQMVRNYDLLQILDKVKVDHK